jgi:Undecaprenyl-phosphate galactose phosphotransferase WbaP
MDKKPIMGSVDKVKGYKNMDVPTQRIPAPKYSIFRHNSRVWMSIILVLADIISLLLAFLIAMTIRLGDSNYFTQLSDYINFIFLLIPTMVVIYNNYHLYPGIGLSSVEEIRRVSVASSLLFLILIALTFLLKTTTIYSRIVFGLAWMLLLFITPLIRNLMRRVCVFLRIWGEPVCIIGFPDRRVAEVADFFVKYPQKGIAVKAIFVQHPDECGDAVRKYQIYTAEDIYLVSKSRRVSTVLVIVSNWNWVGDNLDQLRYNFQRVILVRPQRDNFSLSDSVVLDFNGVMGFQVVHNLLNPWAMVIKRYIDIVASIFALIILSPFLALICLLIRLDSPGPILYHQRRLGKEGKEFKFLKFRSMFINGDEIFEKKLKEDKNFRDEWKKYQKVKNDPRITRIGTFLRKYSVDELPQLINILLGDMSLVGPRPIMVNQREMYGPGFHDYSQIRPGVTGLWQVSGRNHTTFARRTELDMEYIQRWSIWLDLYIIFSTFKEVVSKDGAY